MNVQTTANRKLLLLTDDLVAAGDAESILVSAGALDVRLVSDRPHDVAAPLAVFVAIDLASQRAVETLRRWLKAPQLASVQKSFLIRPNDYRDRRQALALGAHQIIERPLGSQEILEQLRDDMASQFLGMLDKIENTRLAVGLKAAHEVLNLAFENLPKGRPFSSGALDEASYAVADALMEEGLSIWLTTVNQHHSSSYRHSLLVAGSATCFMQFIGASRQDQTRVARAALAHDVGKTLVPLAILDKPGKLDPEEELEIKKHPQFGYDLLVAAGGFPEDTLDAVLNHHEMCDGSGYPRGLAGSEISDLARITTIADIFSALVEVRAYKPALSHAKALGIMSDMGARLDGDLLRMFRQMLRSEPSGE